MTLTQIKPAGLSKPVDLADNEKIRLGTGNDLQIYHDGSNSYLIEGGTGDFYIQGSNIMLENTNGENYVKGMQNSRTELYFDGVKKFETLSGGAAVTGELDVSGTIDMNTDTGRLKLGAGDDLSLWHDGSNSYIANTGGQLRIWAKTDGYAITCTADGSVDLYHNNVKKFETTSAGVLVSGNVYANDDNKFIAGTHNDLQIYHDGTKNLLKSVASTNTEIWSDTFFVKDVTNSGETILKGQVNGAVELYYDNSKKFETTSYGARVYGNLENHDDDIKVHDAGKLVAGNSDDLQVYHNGSNSVIRHDGTGQLYIETTGTDEDITIKANRNIIIQPAAGEAGITVTANGSVELYEDNTKRFETQSGGARVFGHLGVNRDPAGSHPLWVEGPNQYVIGLTNTSASSTNFPWLLHKSINSTQAFGIHFNGLSGDPFHCDKDGGIFLGKETATANRLDDYEIGEYTPTLKGGSSTGTDYSLHGGANTLSYVKVGEQVTLFGRLLITAHNNASGTPHLSLPFNSFGGTEQSGLGQFGIYWHGWNVPNDGVGTASLEFTGNNNYAVMVYQRDNASWAGLNDLRDNMGSLYVAIQGSYRCNT